ncbi:alpha/beta fold hydrolase [Thermocrinis sp.]
MPRSGVRVPPDPLVFIHGWGFSSKVFKNFAGFKLELPYHGDSKLKSLTLRKLAQEMALRIPKGSALIGWSMGGTLALLIAFLYPQKVSHLVLIGSTACFGCLWEKRELRGFLLRLRREREAFLREFRSRAYPRAFEDDMDIDRSSQLLEDYFYTDIRRSVPYIKAPITLIHGIKDGVVPFRSAIELYNLAKRRRLITFDGGHFPEDESIILEVLKSI